MLELKDAYLNLNVRGLGQSATLAIKQRVRELRREGRSVHDLGLGQSPFPVPPSVVDALRFHAAEKDYLPVEGLPALREAVAEYHRRKQGVNVRPEDVLVGPGSKELMFLLQLAFYGDILVPTPCWVSYVPQAQIIGRRVRQIKTRGEEEWRVTPENLAAECRRDRDTHRPRVLILNYPANPHGGSYTPDELKALADVAREFEVIILSDEIYGELQYKGEHRTVAEFYPEGTIVSSGLSKWAGAGGWRIGTFAFPPDLDWLREAMAAIASETYTSVCAPIQYAAVKAYRGGARIERYLWHARRILEAVGERGATILREAGANVNVPAGGFYLFPDFGPVREKLAARGVTDSVALCDRLLEEAGVAVLPGASFEQPSEDLTARLAFVNFDGAQAIMASETIPLHQPLPEDFVDKWCGNTVEAFERIAQWIVQEK